MNSANNDEIYKEWHHSPSHLFVPNCAYIVTAGTYRKEHFFDTPEKRDFLLHTLFEEAHRWEWRLDAWAVMANHYHIVGHAPEERNTLTEFMTALHSRTAVWVNEQDRSPGRKVWYQYRDTCLTYQASYLARLNYVHHNPASHGVAPVAEQYPWCSMAWFLREAEPSYRRTVLSVKYDKVNVYDDF